MTGQTQPLGHSSGMRVHGQSRHAKGITQNHIGRLSANAGQAKQILERSGNFSPVFGHEPLAGVLEMSCFGSKQTGGLNALLDGFHGGLGDGVWGRKLSKKNGRDRIDASISALGGKNRGHEKLKGVLIGQAASSIGIKLLENSQNVRRPFLQRCLSLWGIFHHARLSLSGMEHVLGPERLTGEKASSYGKVHVGFQAA